MNKTVLKFDLNQKDIRIKKILNKEFLELEISAISDIYPNRNKSAFTLKSLEVSKPTCYNKPILGSFNIILNDFREHNGQDRYDEEFQTDYWDCSGSTDEKILGVIRESDKVNIVQDGELHWLKINCILWTFYTYRQVKKLLKSSTKKVSVEVNVEEYHMEDDIMVIDRFTLNGITILGDKISEGIPGAHLNVLDMMKDAKYSQQIKCLSFAYNQKDDNNVNIDNKMSILHTNTFTMEGTRVTYKEKLEFLTIRLTEVYSCEKDDCNGFWICDFSDNFVIIRDYCTDTYYKILYTIDSEDSNKITFDLENKVEQVQTFKDFVEKTIEFNGEQKTIEDFNQMYSDLSTTYSQLEETYNTYKEEMSQKVFTVKIDEAEYDITQLQEKFNSDLAQKDEEIKGFKENIDSLNSELFTAKADLETMTANFNATSEELNGLKQTMKETQEEQVCTEGLKAIESETDIADEDRQCITEKCKSKQYSSIEAVEDDIAKAVYKAHKAKRQTNSFQSNIVRQPIGGSTETKDVFDRLNEYTNI